MKLNKKGFTMVELLVAMAILGLLIIMAFPTIRAIQTNNTNKKFESFGQSLLSGARLYVDSYGEDLFNESVENETVDIKTTDMIKKQIVTNAVINESDCSESTVFVVKYDEDYTYCLYLLCKNNNKVVYEADEKDKKPQCKSFDVVKINYSYNGVTKVDTKAKGITNYAVLSPYSMFPTMPADRFDKWINGGSSYSLGDTISGPINNDITLVASLKGASPDPDIPTPPPPPPTPDPPTPTPDGKPTCTITPNSSPNANNWFKTDVTLTLNTSSNTTNYGLDVSKSSTNKSKSVVVSKEGTTTYYGYVSNSGGSNECSYTVNLDKTPPTVSISHEDNKYKVTAKMTDEVSGLAKYKWKGGDLKTLSGTTQEKTKKIGTDNGKSSIKVTDKADNSTTKEFSAYKWCDKKYSPDNFSIYRWGDITLSCSGDKYYRKYKFHEYECSCTLDDKDHDQVCKSSAKLGNHGSDYAYIYYKHTEAGQKSCKGTYNVNAHVTHVCNSNEYSVTNKPTFDYHGYRFFDGAAQDGWTNFEGKGYTYWRKAGLISNGNSPDTACGIACAKRN